MPLSLSSFSLPLPTNGPPDGYGWEQRDMSVVSSTTAFQAGLNGRDTFLGKRRCVVCGESCEWSDLKTRRWIPAKAKTESGHEPRNGLLMCSQVLNKKQTHKFVFVNYSNLECLQEYHGKAIAINITDHYAPFPALFIVHEMRVRGFQVFQPIYPDIPRDTRYQDWVLSDSQGMIDDVTGSFVRHVPHNGKGNDDDDDDDNRNFPAQLQPSMMSAGGASSDGSTLALNTGVLAEILAATRMMPSWKACIMEGTSWTGTAEENTQKYVSDVGVEER